MIRLEDITKSFGEIVAVKALSLEIEKGEVFVLLGPTGAGKTTTLRIVAGLEKPDQGRVYMEGEDVTGRSPAERNLAFVFESHNLYPMFTVYGNMAFGLRSPLHRLSEEEIRKRVTKVATDLHIDHLLDRNVTTLSGGEMQRTALGRALVRIPKLYLLDEPLSNLDLKLREELRVEFREIHKQYGTTSFYVTHDYVSAMVLADRIGILYQGELLQTGTPEQLYKNPQNTIVASMMGAPAMNFIYCRIVEDKLFLDWEKKVFLELSSRDLELVGRGCRNDEVVLGVWPEDVQVITTSREGSLEVIIGGVEFQGVEILLDLLLGESKIKVLTSPDFAGVLGEKCRIFFPREKIYFFDKKSGKRIYLD